MIDLVPQANQLYAQTAINAAGMHAGTMPT
jgi:hypothetical protein